MPVIGGKEPTVQMTLPVPTPAPMKKKPAPAPAPQPAPQPVPAGNEAQLQPPPQGMMPQPMPVPMARAIILPWSPPPKQKQRPVMRKRVVRFARATPEQIKAAREQMENDPGNPLHRDTLADMLESNGDAEGADNLRKAPQSIEIHGRRWFARTYGNTYHTARIVVNDHDVAGVPRQYGYGDQYLYNAADQLERLGHMPGRNHFNNGSAEAPWRWAQRHGVKSTYSVRDVPRQKDLHQNVSEGFFDKPKQYAAANDPLDFGMDAMYPEGTEEHQRPAPPEDIKGRRRRQILLQMLEAAKKGHYDIMTPREVIEGLEAPPDVPQGGGSVWMSDDEDLLNSREK